MFPTTVNNNGNSRVSAESLGSVASLLRTSGARSAFNANSQPGSSVEGVIESVDVLAVNDFNSQQSAVWANGQPKKQIRIIVQTSVSPVDENDDQRRAVYIKGWGIQKKALIEACKNANVSEPRKGDMFKAVYAGLGERGKAPQPPKVYQYTITRPTGTNSILNTSTNTPTPTPASTSASVSVPVASSGGVWSANIDTNTVMRLFMAGNSVDQIAGFMNAPVDVIQKILDK